MEQTIFCTLCRDLHHNYPAEFPVAAMNTATRRVTLADMNGILLDTIMVCDLHRADLRIDNMSIGVTK